MLRKKLTGVIITIGVMVSILVPAASAANPNLLQDVRRGHWYFGAVQYVVNRELMVGTTNTTFSPNNTVTRGMFVQSLYGQDGRPWVLNVRPSYTDVQVSDWYSNAVAWAKQKNIISGYDDGSFKPNAPYLLKSSDGTNMPDTTSLIMCSLPDAFDMLVNDTILCANTGTTSFLMSSGVL